MDPPPEYAPNMIIIPSFFNRPGGHIFKEPSQLWGYLPQLNEWALKQHVVLEWDVERIGGRDHMPFFRAVPKCKSLHSSYFAKHIHHHLDQGERLDMFGAEGYNKKEAKEKAAMLMAHSGHCVRPYTSSTEVRR